MILTGAGNDHLEGSGGDNHYWDGDGNDTVLGGSGKDFVHVDAGNDLYFGEGGTDRLSLVRCTLVSKDPTRMSFRG